MLGYLQAWQLVREGVAFHALAQEEECKAKPSVPVLDRCVIVADARRHVKALVEAEACPLLRWRKRWSDRSPSATWNGRVDRGQSLVEASECKPRECEKQSGSAG